MTTAPGAPAAPRTAVDPAHDAWLADAVEHPYRYDLWHMLRVLDARHADVPPFGRAPKPDLEPVRIAQEPALAFAPAQIHAIETNAHGGRLRVSILGFGLFGPNGPLPFHLTEYARERLRSYGDRTFARFADILHHRFGLLFYRAWADSQATVSLDRPSEDRFSRYVGSLSGLGDPSTTGRDAVADHAKLFVSGHLVRQTRNAEGLERILAAFFGTMVRVEPWTFRWLALEREQLTRLGAHRAGEQLGVGTVAGARVPDAQSSFRVRIGPLSFDEYEAHLPGGRAFAQLLAWLRNYIGYELAWDARLVLREREVPRASIGSTSRLGFTTWLGQRRPGTDADDLVLVHETIVSRQPLAKAA